MLSDKEIASNIAKNYLLDDVKERFHFYSAIYKFTNENLALSFDENYFSGKKILTVTSSGDQALEAIYKGAESIETFDISRFTKYYLDLKKALILSLTYDEFMSYFFESEENYNDYFSMEIYNKARNYLKKSSQEFWDYLYSIFDAEYLFDSRIFVDHSNAVKKENVSFLDREKYNELKEKLSNKKIITHDIDLFHLTELKSKFDIISLSNILTYNYKTIKNFEDLNAFLNNLSNILNDNGMIFAHYMYNVSVGYISNNITLKEILKNKHFSISKLNQNENTAGILIYKK